MGEGRIRVGIQCETVYPVATLQAVWRAVEDAGFDQLWSSDHLQRTAKSGAATGPILDSWEMLAATAAATKRLRIGVMMTGNLYRHPSLLAKMAVTVDHLSGGRLEVGLGAAWNADEFAALGMAFPDAPERAGRLDEACRVLKALWTEDRATYTGRYYQLVDAIAEPKPLQRPHPPLMIGGRGPKVILRAAARHADAWNSNGRDGVEGDALAVRTLDAHCERIGRDPRTIRRSVRLLAPEDEGRVRTAEQYVALGFTEFVIPLKGEDAMGEVERIARGSLQRIRELA
jgi:F420-dependent oxidoreductase-like protein